MNIYIPHHLKKLGIFRDLERMIIKYNDDYYEDPSYSLSDYQSYLKIDPVLRFVSFCIEKEVGQSQEEYQAILNYVTRLFYSVRGTRRVLEYMGRYLGIKFEGDPVYTTKSISFSITNKTKQYDVSLFDEYLLEFLDYLLYYENLSYKVELNLEIEETKNFYCGVDIKTYKIYKLEV